MVDFMTILKSRLQTLSRDREERRASLDLKDRVESLAHRATGENPDLRDHKDLRARGDNLALMDDLDHKDRLEKSDHRASVESQAVRVRPDLLDHPDLRVNVENLDLKDHKELEEKPDRFVC